MLKAQRRAGAVLQASDPLSSAPALVTSRDLLAHSLLCPPEYDVEAAQEKDRQAFKPTDILRTQKTNCDGYAGLFEKMCRYERRPREGRQSQANHQDPSRLPFQSAAYLCPHATPETGVCKLLSGIQVSPEKVNFSLFNTSVIDFAPSAGLHHALT